MSWLQFVEWLKGARLLLWTPVDKKDGDEINAHGEANSRFHIGRAPFILPFDKGINDVGCPVGRIDEDLIPDFPYGHGIKVKPCDNAKIRTSPFEGPEEVAVFFAIGICDGAICEDNLWLKLVDYAGTEIIRLGD